MDKVTMWYILGATFIYALLGAGNCFLYLKMNKRKYYTNWDLFKQYAFWFVFSLPNIILLIILNNGKKKKSKKTNPNFETYADRNK